MTKLSKIIATAAFAILGTVGSMKVASAEPCETPVVYTSPYTAPTFANPDAIREARERDELARYVARLGQRERDELERYIWVHRLDRFEAARARAHLAEQQRIRDAGDFRHLEAQQRERARRHAYESNRRYATAW